MKRALTLAIAVGSAGGTTNASNPPGEPIEETFAYWARDEQNVLAGRPACVTRDEDITCYGLIGGGSPGAWGGVIVGISTDGGETFTLVDIFGQGEGGSSAASPTPASNTQVQGTFTLIDSDVIRTSAQACRGDGGYRDFKPGMNVTVRNERSEIIGSGAADALPAAQPGQRPELTAAIDDASGDLGHVMCTLYFEVDILDDTAQFFEIEVGSRGALSYSRAELDAQDWWVELSLSS